MKYIFKILPVRGKISIKTVYYDACCNLCNTIVRFAGSYDTYKNFNFVPLQYSEFNQAGCDSIILTDGKTIYKKSDAVLKIVKHLQWPIPWLYTFILVPPLIRNWIYDVISRNRYRWFGKCTTCKITK